MAGKTSGAERDARRILAEAGVAAIDDLRGQVAALKARLAEVERERDEARRQVAVLTEGLRLVSGALARLDQIYRADTDLGDPPVPTLDRTLVQHEAATSTDSIHAPNDERTPDAAAAREIGP